MGEIEFTVDVTNAVVAALNANATETTYMLVGTTWTPPAVGAITAAVDCKTSYAKLAAIMRK